MKTPVAFQNFFTFKKFWYHCSSRRKYLSSVPQEVQRCRIIKLTLTLTVLVSVSFCYVWWVIAYCMASWIFSTTIVFSDSKWRRLCKNCSTPRFTAIPQAVTRPTKQKQKQAETSKSWHTWLYNNRVARLMKLLFVAKVLQVCKRQQIDFFLCFQKSILLCLFQKISFDHSFSIVCIRFLKWKIGDVRSH